MLCGPSAMDTVISIQYHILKISTPNMYKTKQTPKHPKNIPPWTVSLLLNATHDQTIFTNSVFHIINNTHGNKYSIVQVTDSFNIILVVRSQIINRFFLPYLQYTNLVRFYLTYKQFSQIVFFHANIKSDSFLQCKHLVRLFSSM